ncbi:MAG: translation initiation factor IF-3 [Deltaproteobacteria bacterium]
MRVIGAQGEQLGVMLVEQALQVSQESGLDLVEISPTAKPPVCKIMDYGKFKYDEKKRQAQARKKQAVVQIKEVKFRPKTDDHDFDFKVRNVRRFLEEGDKAKLTLMFRGREIVHKDIGQKVLARVVEALKDVAILEQTARMEGRSMFMILAPNPKMKQKSSAPSQPSAQTSASPRPQSQPPRAPSQAPAQVPVEPAQDAPKP